MLGLPLILGAISVSHAPAALEENGVASKLSNTNSELPPAIPVPSPAGAFPSEFLFKTSPDADAPLPLQDSGGAQHRNHSNTKKPALRQRGAGLEAMEASAALTSTLPPSIPSEISTTPSPLDPSSAFTGLSDLTQQTLLRRRGALLYQIKLHTSAVYDNNVSLSQTNPRRALQLGVGPSLKVQLGEDESPARLISNYAGTASSFLDSPRERTYDQILGAASEWTGSRMQASFRGGIQNTRSSTLDAGAQVERKVYTAGATSAYQIGAKTSAELGADFTRVRFNTLLNSSEYRVQEYFNYQYSPKLHLGIGSAQGIAAAKSSPQQTYIQALGRIQTALLKKIDLNAFYGNEWRHFDSELPTTTHPVFGAGASWQATGKTSFTVDTRRHTFASAALEAQNYESTSTSFAAHETLSANLQASLTLGVESSHYSATRADVLAERRDNYRFSRVALGWLARQNCTVETFFDSGKNTAKGAQSQSFRRIRIGVSVNINF
jgi:hypothetical protein